MKEILIYSGQGVNPHSLRCAWSALRRMGHKVRLISAEELKTSEWINKASVLVMPGGRDVPYDRSLRGEGNRRIRSFVLNGGGYLGFCAGGYFGAEKVEFEIGGPLEVSENRELAFFPGSARGPAYGNGRFRYDSEEGSRVAYLDWNGDVPYAAYYNGGCYFHEPEKHAGVEVIARYLDIPENPAAIISCNAGKGRAVLCGVHPEYAVADIPNGNARRIRIKKCLEPFEEKRRKLFDALINSAVHRPVW